MLTIVQRVSVPSRFLALHQLGRLLELLGLHEDQRGREELRVCWRGDSGVDHATGEKGLAQDHKKLKRVPQAKGSLVSKSPLSSRER